MILSRGPRCAFWSTKKRGEIRENLKNNSNKSNNGSKLLKCIDKELPTHPGGSKRATDTLE